MNIFNLGDKVVGIKGTRWERRKGDTYKHLYVSARKKYHTLSYDLVDENNEKQGWAFHHELELADDSERLHELGYNLAKSFMSKRLFINEVPTVPHDFTGVLSMLDMVRIVLNVKDLSIWYDRFDKRLIFQSRDRKEHEFLLHLPITEDTVVTENGLGGICLDEGLVVRTGKVLVIGVE